MRAEVEKWTIGYKDHEMFAQYRCPICGETLIQTIGNIRGMTKNKRCPACGAELVWPEEFPEDGHEQPGR